MSKLKNSHEFSGQLYDAQTSEDKFTLLESLIKEAGFDAIIYSFYPKLSQLSTSIRPVFQFSENLKPLISYYQEKDLSQHDFTIRLVESGRVEIIDWWKEAKTHPLTDQEIQTNKILHDKFDVTKGFTFPTLSSDLGAAGCSVLNFKKEDENQNIDSSILESLHRCIRMYHDHMMVHQNDRYKFIMPLLELLTPKKKIVIKHLISGQPMKNIVDHGVTERYGEKLLLELRKSFGDISKNELIYFLGLLNISEYL